MLLTTFDNPYNPYKDMDKWSNWDHQHKYNTSEYLARITDAIESEYPDIDESTIAIAQLEIVSNDLSGTYALIDENDSTPLSIEAYEQTIKRDKELNE